MQNFANSNIVGTQDVHSGDAVVFPPLSQTGDYYVNGIEYDGIDTFTITRAGLYSLTCVLSLDNGNPPDNTFYVELNGTSPVAGTANLGNDGQIVLTRVGNFAADTAIRIVNGSNHTVTISNATGNPNSAGHLSLFRFADGGVV
ncbi:MAG: hypothetical protein FWC93_05175 [Defluviitaleaceae bacterium]|nr:hypothetical protein [Defluviitaleaceae bacterium]